MNAHQLDLFLDSHEVALANEVIAALRAHDGERAAQSIARLRSQAPERPDLPAFDSLCAFLELTREMGFPRVDRHGVELIVELLNNSVVAAAGVLGGAAKDFLHCFWRQLACAASEPFSPARPHLCAADLFLRAEAYEEAEAAAMVIPAAQTQSAVLRWRAIARYRLAGLKRARGQVLALACYAAEAFPDLLRELDDAPLNQDWLAFQADLDDPDTAWFAAWYLLRHPEAAAAIGDALAAGSEQSAENVPALLACRVLTRILDLEKHGHSPALVEQRARLKAIDGAFFAAYMRTRDVRHL